MLRIIFLLLLLPTLVFSGASAVVTLEMPVGARQLGMGESGVALGDDGNSLYYNPAGLAFGPLANEWELSRKLPQGADSGQFYTSFAARNRRGFLTRNEVWAGTASGMLHFDGELWRDFLTVPLEGNAKLRDVVRTFIGTEVSLDSISGVVRNYNGVKTLKEEEPLVEVKIPFSIMVKDTVAAMLYETRTEKLWVGTAKGLLRFDGRGFKNFASEFGVRRITALANQGATLWIGTDSGLFAYRNGVFEQRGAVLPSQKITSIAWHEMRKELYVGVEDAGIARLIPKQNENEKDKWSVFALQDGIMDLNPRAVAIDSSGHIWVVHKEGLSHFNLMRWEQIRFENNEVHSITVSEKGTIWIGTNKGVWSYLPEYATPSGRKSETELGKSETGNAQGKWSHYHTGNGLESNTVWRVLSLGNDVWLSTGAGVERYHAAQNQVAFFYERLLPVLQLPDLYHLYTGVTFPLGDWGTWGVFLNFISFGETTVADEINPDQVSSFNSSEVVVGLSYGTRLNRNWGMGLNFKFFYSALSSGAALHEPDATTMSYAIDVGILGRDLWIKGLRFGAVLANIGPNVYYVDKSSEQPIPLTWRFGFSYDLLKLPDHRVTLNADYNRTVIYENSKGEIQPFYISAWKSWFNPETSESGDNAFATFRKSFQEGVVNLGTEYVYAGTVALRAGYLHDKVGKRQELDVGFGVMLSDMLQLDIASIQNVGNLEGVRDGQLRFSGLFRF
ncbi:MAG: PorV/PorQ family protein [Fibromonadales bacterium]|nr:PorV/PorQ family protein [Fibromonadales bacterium]